ncbi:MAG TPA: 3-oxoacyl-ACP reductase FabG [Actinomycetota bacterium]|nr:3-oxoacyl-ACP reductase FabG [Actinomycetota bacterium]
MSVETASLEGRVALVTGAGGGIGRASAVALAEEGVRVAVGYRGNKDGAQETVALCEGSMEFNIDVSSTESVSGAFDEIEQAMGPVEILVNNAGITRDGLLMRMGEANWDEVIDTVLKGAYRCTKRALPGMLKGRWGRVISIGSVVGTTGNPGQTNYAAAKAGLVGFSKALALEVAAKGITVNVVAPGLVETDFIANLPQAARDALQSRVPMGRAATADEAAEAVRFCARATYLTGQVIGVNGGLA